ncbi:MAG: DUF3341 domain-containing protein [Deltaproteobacteria bacterium]|nr:DUF3341 domain-containing protein [Deltaproteobacteria bacterium]
MAEEKILGLFPYLDDLLGALKILQGSDSRILAVYSPGRFPEIQEVLGLRPSIVRPLTLLGGILGGLGLVALAINAHLSFKLITSGKPILPPIPFVVPWFEGTILFAVIFSVAAWILNGRLPRTRLPATYDALFSQDRFGILVSGPGGERMARLLRESGAEEIRHVP